ncbi:MAG: hypothetical protein JOS17DRAFT_767177 [Linnemannia elongata]|nr:MAG: hypothetical protein JOS17DRAFT_767177 [Linnemannia elongata]
MTFSGLLSKTLKHNAAANSATAAGATKSGAVAKATTATSAGTTNTQGATIVSPKTDSFLAPVPDSVSSIMDSSPSLPPQQQQPPQLTSIDPMVLSVDPRSSSPSQVQVLSSPPAQHHPTITTLDMKLPAPLSPSSTTPSSPSTAGATTATTKKKQQQQGLQNLSTAQSASYRKRLNVNQVCDWCRYRKIRCDREAPCNSCQHSKRECIRTPPEVLLSKLNSKDIENSSTTTTESTSTISKVTKRSCPDDEQGDQTLSLKTKKVARSNSVAPSSSSSHINLKHNNINNNSTASTTLSPAMSSSLSLSPPSTMGLSLCGDQPQQPMTILTSGIQGTRSSLQDQEHLERIRRIEMLLSNVIPGAAEFIAHGHHHNHQKSDSFSVTPSSEHIMSPISPTLTAAGSPLGLTPIQDDSYIERMKRIELLLGSVQKNNCNNALVTKLSLAVPPSTTSADTTGSKSSSNDDAKKEPTPTTARKNKSTGTKKVARNSDGTIIKRPHVAAGFAGQKPPPKLPQAIAEAALKKQAGKKKKRASASSATSAAAAAAAAAVVPATSVVPAIPAATTASAAPASAVTVKGTPASPVSTIATSTPPVQSPSVPQPKAEAPAPVTLSSPKSFDIPATIESHHHHIQENALLSFTQQQLQQQKQRQRQQKEGGQILNRQQQHPHPGRLNTQLSTSTSYHPHHQQHQRHTPTPPSSYLGGGGGHMTNIGSISIPTIPLSNTMASYESLVVPACNSADSSPASSPRTLTTTIEFPTIGGIINGSSVSVCGPGSTSPLTPMDFLGYGTTSSHHHSSFGPTMHNGSVSGGARANFSMSLKMIHPGPTGTTDQLVFPIDQALLPFSTHGAAAAAPMYSPHHNLHFLQQQAMHILQDNMAPTHTPISLRMQDLTNGALQTTESLESWMNSQLVPSLDVFSSNSNPAPPPHTNSPFLASPGFGQSQPQPQQMLVQSQPQPQQMLVQMQPQHRSPIQHQYQHQQSFYIPQMQDDEEDNDGVAEVSQE